MGALVWVHLLLNPSFSFNKMSTLFWLSVVIMQLTGMARSCKAWHQGEGKGKTKDGLEGTIKEWTGEELQRWGKIVVDISSGAATTLVVLVSMFELANGLSL